MGEYLVELLSKRPDWTVTVTSRRARLDRENVRYRVGNARDRDFMKQLLSEQNFDAIVDFMNYGYDEFAGCFHALLSATDHYIFLSSSRVYADSAAPITEKSPRLLDVSSDTAFLQTQRYALRKARQENLLTESGKSNFSIIRPYITYSNRRLQLGIYEKEQWLYRLLNHKPVIIRDEILTRRTTLTHGKDVSTVLSRVMDSAPLAGPVQIMTSETMRWGDILKLYLQVLEEALGPGACNVYTCPSMEEIESLFEGGYNTKYDRLYDRVFDPSFAEQMFGHVAYTPMAQGLQTCLEELIRDWKDQGNRVFLPPAWDYEAIMDRMLSINRETPEMDEAGRKQYHEILNQTAAPARVSRLQSPPCL